MPKLIDWDFILVPFATSIWKRRGEQGGVQVHRGFYIFGIRFMVLQLDSNV